MEDKWISVDTELPERNKLVIASHNKDRWVIAAQINDDGLWYSQFQNNYWNDPHIIVTHWQPLPPPPTKPVKGRN